MENQKRTRLIVGLLGLLLVVIIGLVAYVYVSSNMKEESYREAVESADKYIAEHNYEDAIISLRRAISIKPEEETLYLKLADAYINVGDEASAQLALNDGIRITGSTQLKDMLARLQGASQMVEIGGADKKKEEQPADIANASPNIGWDASFIQKLGFYTFEDFSRDFGSVVSAEVDSDGFLEIRHNGLDAVFYYRNTDTNDEIVDITRKIPYSTGMPEKVVLGDMSLLFRNFEGAVSLNRLQMLMGERVTPKTMEGQAYIQKELDYILVKLGTDADGNVVSSEDWNEIELLNANKAANKDGQLAGIVLDAVTGNGVNGAEVHFVPTTDGEDKTVTTNADGSFFVQLKADVYEIVIKASGYVEETFAFDIEEGHSYSGEQFIISPELATGSARIVLEWNAEPTDLDSYLEGTTDGGDTIYTNFTHKKASVNGKDIAELDLDDTNGYGPETTTIYDLNGVYEFSVADFLRTGTMSQHGATVKVYLPGKPVETITLNASSGVRDIWNVCVIDHGELRILNSAPATDEFEGENK
ncbi:carboxypeptidase regulatory-like domain-containing protein [Frisingicoccus sp.]|uniref:carboxypeptidase regulatory-like domain-containing protein n=1 Tax=Frisingicoccus sp. TaxID=1918627 RepID=UPI003AB18976